VKQELFRDGYTVDIERDPLTGIVTYEAWFKDGRLDHPGGPAVVLRDAATGTVTFEAWYRRGLLHRTNGPAYIERDPTGIAVVEEWWKDGVSCTAEFTR
jgi:hypothetical protein